MCGLIGVVNKNKPALTTLIQGLKSLEYRGYDSAGIAVSDRKKSLIFKVVGQPELLQKIIREEQQLTFKGLLGIGHTRWATHGQVVKKNAHPHRSDNLYLVHNGIIENHLKLRNQLIGLGYIFKSETDSEVIVHLLHHTLKTEPDKLKATHCVIKQLEGRFGIAFYDQKEGDKLYVYRAGSPLVIGLGDEGNYISSDELSLHNVAHKFIHLAEGDFAEITHDTICCYDQKQQLKKNVSTKLKKQDKYNGKGKFSHFMQKELYEQPDIAERLVNKYFNLDGLKETTEKTWLRKVFKNVENIHIVACGTSYHAGLIAKQWIEQQTTITCSVEVASEYRYREFKIPQNTVFICISQSGETADTLEALLKAKKRNYLGTVALCNVDTSSIAKEADHTFLTEAGLEISVASTKAFTAQLVVLQIITYVLTCLNKKMPENKLLAWRNALLRLPEQMRKTLLLEQEIKKLAGESIFIKNQATLFIGRGTQHPVVMEGALKLKELSYIHSEAYAAGELKHGPLALIDENIGTVSVISYNNTTNKMIANLEEIKARKGVVVVFADYRCCLPDMIDYYIALPECDDLTSPIMNILPLQLLAYHVTLHKNLNVDHPKNLAKSVTVE